MNYETARKMAAEGDAAAQCYLGHMYEEGKGIEPDIQTAVSWFYCAAMQGNAPAQWKLGKMYGEGVGVAVDPEASFSWYQLAAEQGFSDVICPLLGGPKSMLFWTRKEKTNAIQETHAGGDYRQAA